jgi:ubiquinol-cytochrome c reductase cytochrome c1 subunit
MGAMRGCLLAGLLLVGLLLTGVATIGDARAQEAEPPPAQSWSFSGPFGTYDLAAAQRGFQVYSEVCSNCHSMQLMYYRNLTGLGLTMDQIKAIAAAVQVPSGLNDQGEPVQGPGLPSSHFRSPFPNEQAARAANNGALPPDLSLIVNAREGGPDYVYGVLTGYADPPEGFTMQQGMNYNKYFPGHQIAMPKPLSDGQVTFQGDAPNTVDQMAHDVVTFLAWTSNPEMVQRKQIGVRAVLFLALMTGLTYAVKRKVWSEVHH